MLLLSISILSVEAQQKKWEQTYANSINWQKVSSLGHLIAGTNQGVIGIDPETGNINWTNSEIGRIPPTAISQIGSSPLFSVKKESDIFMIDPFSGNTVFDSNKAGISEINDQSVLYQNSSILISGKSSGGKDIIVVSSFATGEVLWKIEDDYGRLITAQELAGNDLLIVTLFYNYRINAQTGEIIWKNDVSEANDQLKSLGAFGNLVKNVATEVAQDIDFNIKFYKHPDKPLFFIASEQEAQSFSQSSVTSYKTEYTAFSIEDGARFWSEPLSVNGRMGHLHFYGDNLVVMPNDPSNTKVNLYNLDSKSGSWGKKGRGIRFKGGVYSYLPLEDGLVMVTNSADRNFVYYMDLSAGISAYEKPTKIGGELRQSVAAPAGLIYITTSELNILNKSDGSLRFDKSIATNPSLVTQDDNYLYAYDVRSSTVKKIDKGTGTVNTLSGEITFQGKETPNRIALSDNGLLLTSAQNLAFISVDGSTVHNTYFEAPRDPGIVRALYFAEAVRASYISTASYAASAVYTSAGEDVKQDSEVGSVVLTGIGDAYNELGDQASDFAKQSFKAASARFKATKEGSDYSVILTQVDKEIFLYQVEKKTGAVLAKVSLGKDREPNYEMDGVTGTIFYLESPTNLISYQF